MDGGVPSICVTDPTGTCVVPYTTTPHDSNAGGPQREAAFGCCTPTVASTASSRVGRRNGEAPVRRRGRRPQLPVRHDDRQLMEHTDGEIPNYWAYQAVRPAGSCSSRSPRTAPDHLYMVSGWSAAPANNPLGCMSDLDNPGGEHNGKPEYAWTDVTYLLHKNGVSWNYFVASGDEAGLRGRRDDVHASGPGLPQARLLERAAVVRRRQGQQRGGQRPRRHAVLRTWRRAAGRRHLAHPERRAERAPTRPCPRAGRRT